ncbi:WD40-repeat-containing domain protein [Cladochytrium replicatum]|nr:WD40-repeat-containing domain protein [Cladochytrium replicatum]
MYHQPRSIPPSTGAGVALQPPSIVSGPSGPPPSTGSGPQPSSGQPPLGNSIQPQMMPQQHGSTRLSDLMSELKAEFDVLAHENNALRSWREDSEHKFEQQIQEVGNLKKYLEQLDHMQRATKEAYDREIRHLNLQLESRIHQGGGGAGSGPQSSVQQQQAGTPQQHGVGRGFPEQGMPLPGYPGQGPQSQASGSAPGHTNGSSVAAPVPDAHIVKRIRGEDGGSVPVSREGYPGAAYSDLPQQPTPPPAQSKRPGKHVLDERGQGPVEEHKGQWRGSVNSAPTPAAIAQQLGSQVSTQQGYRGPEPTSDGRRAGGGVPPGSQHVSIPPGAAPSGGPQHAANVGRDGMAVTGINEMDVKSLPAGYKVDRKAWSAYFNPVSPVVRNARLNIEMTGSFDHQSVVCCVKFSNDGKLLATGSNHSTHIFDVTTKQSVCTLADESASKEQDLYIRSVVFSPDNQYLATGAEDRLVRIWHIPSRTIRHSLVGHESDIYSLDWSRDGRVVASGSGDWCVKIWDPETGRLLMTLNNEPDPTIFGETAQQVSQREKGITSVAFRPNDGRTVVCGSLDHMIRVWDLRTGQLLERFEGHNHSVYSVAFSPNGRSIVSGSLDKMVMVWDLSPTTLEYLSRVDQFDQQTLDPTKRSKEGPMGVPGVGSGTVGVNAPQPYVNTRFRQRFRGHGDYVLSVACAGNLAEQRGDGEHSELGEFEWVVSGSKDRRVTFWDARNGKWGSGQTDERATTEHDPRAAPIFVLQGHKNSVISIALAPAGGLFATGSGDYTARVWRISTERGPVPLLPGPGAEKTVETAMAVDVPTGAASATAATATSGEQQQHQGTTSQSPQTEHAPASLTLPLQRRSETPEVDKGSNGNGEEGGAEGKSGSREGEAAAGGRAPSEEGGSMMVDEPEEGEAELSGEGGNGMSADEDKRKRS